MTKILFVGTHGTDDPTRATFPFQEPRGVVEAGHETGIMLLGEATRLIKGDVARTVQGVGTPPLEELIDWLFARGVRISI